MRALILCGALAAGEYAASLIPFFSDLWPLAAGLAAMVALFGHGLAWRYWRPLALLLLGAALFWASASPAEDFYRLKPWLRGRSHYARADRAGPVLRAVRRDLARRAELGLGHDPTTAGLNRAIILGERRALSQSVKDTFVRSGTMHVFAISGLHVMTVSCVLVFVLSVFFLPRRWAGVASLPVLWGYVLVIGSPPSAMRAALMASFYLVAPVFWRRPNAVRAWTLAFLVLHVLNPALIVQVGSVLSFLVMLTIVLVIEYGRGLSSGKRFLLVTLAVWAVGVPISAHVFGRVTPGGILANLVLISAAGFVVLTGVVGMLASFLSVTLAVHFNNLSALITRAMVGVAEGVSRLPGANFEVEKWPISVCLAWYAALAVVFVLFVRWTQSRRSRI